MIYAKIQTILKPKLLCILKQVESCGDLNMLGVNHQNILEYSIKLWKEIILFLILHQYLVTRCFLYKVDLYWYITNQSIQAWPRMAWLVCVFVENSHLTLCYMHIFFTLYKWCSMMTQLVIQIHLTHQYLPLFIMIVQDHLKIHTKDTVSLHYHPIQYTVEVDITCFAPDYFDWNY